MTADGIAPVDAPIRELAPLLAQGRIHAELLVQACLARIGRFDRCGPGLSAIRCLVESAESDARELDAEFVRTGRTRGPLHGIPMVLKDNIDLCGFPTTSGNCAMARATALADAEQVRRLRLAGALVIAKANLSEFSFEIRSRSSLGGDVLNPFDRSVTAGGSSGGVAAAVAAGFGVAGLGTDTGGSIRVPSSFNGLVGLRPTHGRLSLFGVAPLAPSTDTIGPIVRCVQDAATLLGVMSGTSGHAWLPDASSDRRRLRGARIGVVRQAFGQDPVVIGAMEGALATMSEAGAVVIDPATLPTDALPELRPHIVDWEFAAAFDAYLARNFAPGSAPSSLAEIYATRAFLPDYRETLERRLAIGSLDCAEYRAIRAYHASLRSALHALMQRHRLDALVYPTSVVVPASLENPGCGWAAELAACSGWPAVTLPVARSPKGIPIGIELLGSAGAESSLLGIADDLEQRGPGRPVPGLGG